MKDNKRIMKILMILLLSSVLLTSCGKVGKTVGKAIFMVSQAADNNND